MIYTLERRKGRCEGSLVTWYEVIQYSGKSEKTGCLLNGETIADFDTKAEAKKYISENNIIITEA